MKIDRVIGIVTILLRQDRVTAPELARRFEVSRRTISRDIDDLCRAGIPIATAQGRGGGISIADGYRIDKALFTDEELQTIFAGLKGMDSVSRTSQLASTLDKLSTRDRPLAAQDAVTIDLSSFYRGPLTEKIEAIQRAIQRRNRISFRYYYEKGECARVIEPYRLEFKWSSWYVFGYCAERQDFRMFKLNRLWELRVLEDTFAPREIPTREDHFAAGGIRLKAIFAASEKYRLIEEYGPECFSPTDSGALLLERDFVSSANLREWILSFGDRATVLEPEALRDDLRRQAENLLAKYQKT